MKRFVYKTFFFLFPIMVFLIGIEMYVRTDANSFKSIAHYFEDNKSEIEVLVLGSSHNQNGINPKYFTQKTANVSYGAQDIKIDSALVFDNIKEMKNLKTIIFEMDYHRMDIENEPNFYRYPWYYFYYDVEIYPINWFNKVSLYYSNPDFFNDILFKELRKSYQPQVINKFGYVESNYDNEFERMEYDSLKIYNGASERLRNRHKEISVKAFADNKIRIEALIDFCKRQHIKLYFFSTPLLKTYNLNKIKSKNDKFIGFINELKTKHNIVYFDFQQDERFHLKDFRNDDHLNAEGAKKYSLLLNEIINKKGFQ